MKRYQDLRDRNFVSQAVLDSKDTAFRSAQASYEQAQAQSAGGANAPRPWGQNPDGMRVYLWAGLKSHQPGQHDYPQFLADWSKILTEHGAVVGSGRLSPQRHPWLADHVVHGAVLGLAGGLIHLAVFG